MERPDRRAVARALAWAAAGFALGSAVLARVFVLPHVEAGAGLLDPNLGTAVAASIAEVASAVLAAATSVVLAVSWLATRGSASAARVRAWAGVAAAGAAWLWSRGVPDLYAAYALVDRTLASPEIHARRAEHLHVVADGVLAAVVVALGFVVAGLLATGGAGCEHAGADPEASGDPPAPADSDAVRKAA